ncbi:MAG: DUF4129 domain-containing protein [Chloroflexota bacterium]
MSLLAIPLDRHRGLIYLLLVVAEAAWLSAVSFSVVQPAVSQPSWFVAVIVLAGIALMLGWLTDVYGVPPQLTRIVGLIVAVFGISLLTYLALLPRFTSFLTLGWIGLLLRSLIVDVQIDFVVAFLASILTNGYIWWRCLALGFQIPQPTLSSPTLRIGFLGFIVTLVLGRTRLILEPSLFLMFLFVGCGLVALMLSDTQTIAMHHGTGAAGTISKRFLNSSAILVLVVLIAFILLSIFTQQTVQMLFGWLAYLYILLVSPFVYILTWVLTLLGPLFDAVFDYLQSLVGEVEVAPQQIEQAGEQEEPEIELVQGEPVWWIQYLRWGWRTFLVLCIVWFLYRLVGRFTRRFSQPVKQTEQETTTVEPEAANLADLWNTGKERLSNLVDMVRRFGVGSDLRAAIAIRRIYAALVVLANQHGLERTVSQTPSEFLAPLTENWPLLEPQLKIITEAYILVHYGELPEGEASLTSVQEAWQIVFEAIKEQQT